MSSGITASSASLNRLNANEVSIKTLTVNDLQLKSEPKLYFTAYYDYSQFSEDASIWEETPYGWKFIETINLYDNIDITRGNIIGSIAWNANSFNIVGSTRKLHQDIITINLMNDTFTTAIAGYESDTYEYTKGIPLISTNLINSGNNLKNFTKFKLSINEDGDSTYGTRTVQLFID